MRLLLLAAGLLALAAEEPKRAPVDPDKAPEAAPDGKQGPPPIEYTLTVKEGTWRVRVTLRPGQPEANRKMEMLLDVARTPDTPDPQYGDRIPLQNAKLSITLSGAGEPERHRLWPMGDAGVYGTHWTPSARGLWTVLLEPLERDAKVEAPRVQFHVGVGVPMPASSEGQAVRSTRVVRAGAPVAEGQPTLTELMRKIAAHWTELGRGLDEADEKAALAALGPLVDQLPGQAPRGFGAEAGEFDNIARKLKADLAALAGSPSEAHAQVAGQTEVDTCLRCHVKFRDGVVQDVSQWPEVKPWKR